MQPIPVLGRVGAGLLKVSTQAINQYDLMTIKGIAKLTEGEAFDLLEKTMADREDNPRDPKIYIALAIAASNDFDNFNRHIRQVWKAYYEPDGTSGYNGEIRTIREDFEQVRGIMRPLTNRPIDDFYFKPEASSKPRM